MCGRHPMSWTASRTCAAGTDICGWYQGDRPDVDIERGAESVAAGLYKETTIFARFRRDVFRGRCPSRPGRAALVVESSVNPLRKVFLGLLPLWLPEPDLVRIAPDHMSLVVPRGKYFVIMGINRMLLRAAAVIGRQTHSKYLIWSDYALARFAAAGMGVVLLATARRVGMCARGPHEHGLAREIALAEERSVCVTKCLCGLREFVK